MKSTLMKSTIQNSFRLGLFAIFTVGLIAITFVLTKDKIKYQIRQFEIKALDEILPNSLYDNSLLDTRVQLKPSNLLATTTNKDAYVALKNNIPIAVILPVNAPDGYSGKIELLVSIYANNFIAGVRAIKHKETPGLGDKINILISPWINTFSGKSLKNPNSQGWKVHKDGGEFDQFTGATITPRAVVSAVYRSLQYFKENKEKIFHQVQSDNTKRANQNEPY